MPNPPGAANTDDYNDNNNWTPAAAPVLAGQAFFDAAGSSTVSLTSGAVTPDSWTFNANSQSYSISGDNVNFGIGLTNNASAGQFVGITNIIGGAGAAVQQLGASTLILAGANTYGGGTLISAGTLQANNGSAVGTSAVVLDGGTFQAGGIVGLTFTNNFFVNATGGTIDANGIALELSGDINGAGTLTITDSSFSFSTVVLSGNNGGLTGLNVTGARVQAITSDSLAGSMVTLDNGAIQAGAAGLAAFFQDFKLNTGGGILDSNGNTWSIAGTISDGNGPGALQIVDTAGGGGVTELAGTNTYTGGTTVIGTTLQVTNSASVGTGTVTLDNAVLRTDSISDVTLANSFKINSTAGGGTFAGGGTEYEGYWCKNPGIGRCDTAAESGDDLWRTLFIWR